MLLLIYLFFPFFSLSVFGLGGDATNQNIWYLDFGASNHMSGDKIFFMKFDESMNGYLTICMGAFFVSQSAATGNKNKQKIPWFLLMKLGYSFLGGSLVFEIAWHRCSQLGLSLLLLSRLFNRAALKLLTDMHPSLKTGHSWTIKR